MMKMLIDLVNKTAVVAGICNFDVSQIDIAHRVSEEGTAPIIVLFNRKADRTNFYRQKKKLFKVQANHSVKPNNEDHSDSEVSLPGLEQENSYIYMNGILAKLCKYVQEETMKNLFNSFLKLYIEYGKLAWGGAPKTKIELRSIKCSIRTMDNLDKWINLTL